MRNSNMPWWASLSLPITGAPSLGVLQKLILEHGTNLPAIMESICAKSPSSCYLGKYWTTQQFPPPALRLLEACEQLDITAICPEDSCYPSCLLHAGGFSPLLYLRGNMPKPELYPFGIVGTRQPSPQGVELTQRCIENLASYPVCIISGLAHGIDACAHAASLHHGLQTLAVLGEGLASLPSGHRGRLAQEILDAGGALLSQFAPSQTPHKGCFPTRNRTLAAICKTILVPESRLQGGAMNTAAHAQNLSVPLVCFPGDPLRETCRGPNFLIRSGKASILWEIEDLPIQLGLIPCKPSEKYPINLNSEQWHLWTQCSGEMLSLATILARTRLPVHRAIAILSCLELEGALRVLPGRNYSFRPLP